MHLTINRMTLPAKALQARARRLRALVLLALMAALAIMPASAKYVQTLNLAGLDGVTSKDLVDALWPVGSIYMSYDNATNPGDATSGIFQGTYWTAITGYTLVGKAASGTFNVMAGNTGGAESANITLAETNIPQMSITIPDHAHSYTLATIGTSYGGSSGTSGFRNNQSGTTSAAGGGTYSVGTASPAPLTVSRLQPYMVVYMWRRTA